MDEIKPAEPVDQPVNKEDSIVVEKPSWIIENHVPTGNDKVGESHAIKVGRIMFNGPEYHEVRVPRDNKDTQVGKHLDDQQSAIIGHGGSGKKQLIKNCFNRCARTVSAVATVGNLNYTVKQHAGGSPEYQHARGSADAKADRFVLVDSQHTGGTTASKSASYVPVKSTKYQHIGGEEAAKASGYVTMKSTKYQHTGGSSEYQHARGSAAAEAYDFVLVDSQSAGGTTAAEADDFVLIDFPSFVHAGSEDSSKNED